MSRTRSRRGRYGGHDPLSLLVACDPSLVTLRPCEADGRSHRVTVGVEPDRAVDVFASALKRVFGRVKDRAPSAP